MSADGWLKARAWLGLAQVAVAMGLALFLSAGTVRWVHGWVYLLVFIGASLVVTLYLMKHDPALLARVCDSNNLAANPKFVPPDMQPPPTREQLIAQLDQIVDVKLRKGTRLIDIRVEHTDPRLATTIIRRWAG